MKIEFDLYCNWNETPPAYRIYADDELLTERVYSWTNDEYVIREIINVVEPPKIITVRPIIGSGIFSIKNVQGGIKVIIQP